MVSITWPCDGMTYEEEDWVDKDATAHPGSDE
jgi:hypothetical protein